LVVVGFFSLQQELPGNRSPYSMLTDFQENTSDLSAFWLCACFFW